MITLGVDILYSQDVLYSHHSPPTEAQQLLDMFQEPSTLKNHCQLMRPLAAHLLLESSPDTRYNRGYPILQMEFSWHSQREREGERERKRATYIQRYTYILDKVKCLAGWCGYPHQNCKDTCQTTQQTCKKWCRLETKGTAQATVSENTPMKKNVLESKTHQNKFVRDKKQSFFFSIYNVHPCFVC